MAGCLQLVTMVLMLVMAEVTMVVDAMSEGVEPGRRGLAVVRRGGLLRRLEAPGVARIVSMLLLSVRMVVVVVELSLD